MIKINKVIYTRGTKDKTCTTLVGSMYEKRKNQHSVNHIECCEMEYDRIVGSPKGDHVIYNKEYDDHIGEMHQDGQS